MHKRLTNNFHYPLFYLLIFSFPLIGYAPINLFGGIQISYMLGVILMIILVIANLVFNKRIYFFNQRPSRIVMIWLCVVIIVSLVLSLVIPVEYQRYYFQERALLKTLKTIAKLLIVISIYFVSLPLLRQEKVFRKALRFLIYGAVFSSIYGLYQIIAYKCQLPFANIFSHNISFGGEIETVRQWGWQGMVRIASTGYEPSIFANFLLLVIPVYGLLILNNQRVLKTYRRDCIAFGLIFLAFVLTFSRGGWLALLFSLLLFTLYTVKNKKRGFLSFAKRGFPLFASTCFLLCLVFIFAFGKPDIRKIILKRFNFIVSLLKRELTEGKDYGYDHRVTSYGVGANIIKQYPLFGIGLGNYGFYYEGNLPAWGSDYITRWEFRGTWSNPKGIYMHLLTDTGIIGFFIFFLFIANVMRENSQYIKKSDNEHLRTIASGLRISFFAIMVHGVSLSFLYFSHWWFLLAAMIAQKNHVDQKHYRTRGIRYEK